MKAEKSSASSFTVPLVFAVFLAAFVVALLVEPWLHGAGLGPYSWLVLLVVYIAIVAFVLKRVVLRSLPERYELEAMTLQQFASAEGCTAGPMAPIPTPSARQAVKRQIDELRIESLTDQLLRLGFQFRREGRLKAIGAKNLPAYVRLFEHPEGSLAGVMQFFTQLGPVPVSCTLQNSFDDDWGWSDSNAKRHWLIFMMRRPRMLGRVHPADTPLTEMWASCRSNSEKMQRELKVGRVPLLASDYEAHLNHALPQLKAAFRRKNILAGIIEGIFVMPRTSEWWGEFHRYADRNRC